MVLHRFRLIALLVVLAAGATLAIHVGAQPPAPGRTLTWAASAPTSPASRGAVQAAPPASAAALPDAGPLGGLRVPLSGLLRQLNSETKATAVGQYSILQELANALRVRLDQLLSWITRGH